MKKKILSLLLATSFVMTAASCKSNDDTSYYKLSNFQPTAENEAYDTDVLYKNLSQFWGGDSGVIYVSEEEGGPEYGGYFYQYMSGCAGVYNGDLSSNAVPSDKNGNAATKESDIDHYGFVACSRSKDLNDWELCGAVDNGFCLTVEPDSWIMSSVWAPETIYDAKTQKYYMYFAAKSKINPGNNPDLHYSNDNWDVFKRFYISVAVSDTPVGPFKLVSSAEYYGENGQKNENGQVVDLNGDVVDRKNPVMNIGYYFKNNPNSIYRDKLKDVAYPRWSGIDPSPFFDENGDLYIYFSEHGNNIGETTMITDTNDPDYDGAQYTNEVWGMKMKDMITCDYESMRLVVPSVKSHSNSDQYENFDAYVRCEYKGEMEGNDPADYPVYEFASYKRYLSWDDDDPEEKWNVSSNTEDYNNCGNIVEGPQMITTKDKYGKTVYIMTYAPLGVGAAKYDIKWAYSYDPLKGFIKPKGAEFSSILGVDINNDFMTNLGHAAIVKAGDEIWISHWEYPEAFSNWDSGRIHAVTRMTWVDVEGYDFPIPVGNGPNKSCQAKPQVSTGYKNISSLAKITVSKGDKDTVKYLNDDLVVTASKFADKQFSSKGKTKVTMSFDSAQTIRGILIHNSYSYDTAFKDIVHLKFTLEDGSVIGIDKVGLDMDYVTEESESSVGWIEPGLAAVATFGEIKVTKIEFTVENFYNANGNFKISEIEVLGK